MRTDTQIIAGLVIATGFAFLICFSMQYIISKSPTRISEPLTQEVIIYFDVINWDRITDIPIYKRWDIRTAMALTEREVRRDQVAVLVSPNWQNFTESFRRNLLIHEFLHILEAEKGVDIKQFSNEVYAWYEDITWGEPTPAGNYVKYILFWNVYGGNGFPIPPEYKKQEEFAYIGVHLAYQRGYEVPIAIKAYYDGILQTDFIA